MRISKPKALRGIRKFDVTTIDALETALEFMRAASKTSEEPEPRASKVRRGSGVEVDRALKQLLEFVIPDFVEVGLATEAAEERFFAPGIAVRPRRSEH